MPVDSPSASGNLPAHQDAIPDVPTRITCVNEAMNRCSVVFQYMPDGTVQVLEPAQQHTGKQIQIVQGVSDVGTFVEAFLEKERVRIQSLLQNQEKESSYIEVKLIKGGVAGLHIQDIRGETILLLTDVKAREKMIVGQATANLCSALIWLESTIKGNPDAASNNDILGSLQRLKEQITNAQGGHDTFSEMDIAEEMRLAIAFSTETLSRYFRNELEADVGAKSLIVHSHKNCVWEAVLIPIITLMQKLPPEEPVRVSLEVPPQSPALLKFQKNGVRVDQTTASPKKLEQSDQYLGNMIASARSSHERDGAIALHGQSIQSDELITIRNRTEPKGAAIASRIHFEKELQPGPIMVRPPIAIEAKRPVRVRVLEGDSDENVRMVLKSLEDTYMTPSELIDVALKGRGDLEATTTEVDEEKARELLCNPHIEIIVEENARGILIVHKPHDNFAESLLEDEGYGTMTEPTEKPFIDAKAAFLSLLGKKRVAFFPKFVISSAIRRPERRRAIGSKLIGQFFRGAQGIKAATGYTISTFSLNAPLASGEFPRARFRSAGGVFDVYDSSNAAAIGTKSVSDSSTVPVTDLIREKIPSCIDSDNPEQAEVPWTKYYTVYYGDIPSIASGSS